MSLVKNVAWLACAALLIAVVALSRDGSAVRAVTDLIGDTEPTALDAS